MATYVIGDVQGCFDELEQLLRNARFGAQDRLWFLGDLVNRGPKSIEVLRFVRELGPRAATVLGNHDLHLIAQFEGLEGPKRSDTFEDVLDSPQAAELVGWLRGQPMMVMDERYAMVHAGLLPQWTIGRARTLAKEVEDALRGPNHREFLKHMYGNKPARWDEALTGWDRLRVIVNAMTRMRFCDERGRIDLEGKGTEPAKGYRRWYELRRRESRQLFFGHWSQLGLVMEPAVTGLDSGCVWGGALSALRLEDRTLYQVPCRGYQPVGGEA